jgi:hypothetical protein
MPLKNATKCSSRSPEAAMTITVFIRYQLDPSQCDAFDAFSIGLEPRAIGLIGGEAIERDQAVGNVVGAFMRHPIAAEISTTLWPANFRFAQERRFILSEERTFLRPVT